MAGEVGDCGGVGHVGEERAGEIEGCAAVDGGGGGGCATWLGEIHVRGVETVFGVFLEMVVRWFWVVVVVKGRQVWL